ncbi:MAG: di-heme enzyme [Deltaproteobacteria bacterium]|nr:di-heme enzyme [Deltaproteobacteria bacterium]
MFRCALGGSTLLLAVLSLGAAGCGDDGGGAGADDPEPGSTGEPTASSDGPAATTDADTDTDAEDSSSGDDPGRTPTDEPPEPEEWVWDLPTGFPVPAVPEDNPMSAAKVELGRHLFYDERLSVNGTTSCASCHRQELAFTDGGAVSTGATGDQTSRGSMSLANVAYASTLGWGNPTLLSLEAHALLPLFGNDPIEMGLLDEADIVGKIADDPIYVDLFEDAYPNEAQPITLAHASGSIASFQRTLISGRSPFDRWFYDSDESAISESAKRGYNLFHVRGECFYCHFSFNFSDATYFESLPELTTPFHNIGLYNIDGEGAYPQGNTGVHAFTGAPEDMGRFKSPTLRNIVVTGPYMHDGSIETLPEVLEHYGAGGRTIAEGPHAGVGADNPFKDPLMVTFELQDHELVDMMAWFESLTDEEFLTNPAFSNPWE